MPDFLYTSFHTDLLRGRVNLEDDTIKVMLVTAAYDPDPGHSRLSQVTHEVRGAGYEPGGKKLNNKEVVESPDGGAALQADDLVWPESSITGARWAVAYKSRGGPPKEDELVACYDLHKEVTSTDGDFRVRLSPEGLIGSGG
jgi:hypothetical protein